MDIVREECRKKTGHMNPNSLSDSTTMQISFSGKELKKLEGFWWDCQHIGYPNTLLKLKGYPHFQRAEFLETKLELLKLKRAPESEINEVKNMLSSTVEQINKFKKAYPVD